MSWRRRRLWLLLLLCTFILSRLFYLRNALYLNVYQFPLISVHKTIGNLETKNRTNRDDRRKKKNSKIKNEQTGYNNNIKFQLKSTEQKKNRRFFLPHTETFKIQFSISIFHVMLKNNSIFSSKICLYKMTLLNSLLFILLQHGFLFSKIDEISKCLKSLILNNFFLVLIVHDLNFFFKVKKKLYHTNTPHITVANGCHLE